MIRDSKIIPPQLVRNAYCKLAPLTALKPELRGWTLNVLNLVREIRKPEFTLGEVYERETILAKMYPGNHNVRAKIRQQLQILRDAGILQFLGNGKYSFAE